MEINSPFHNENKKFSVLKLLIFVIGECIGMPLCIAGGEAFVNEQYTRAFVGFGIGIPFQIFGAVVLFGPVFKKIHEWFMDSNTPSNQIHISRRYSILMGIALFCFSFGIIYALVESVLELKQTQAHASSMSIDDTQEINSLTHQVASLQQQLNTQRNSQQATGSMFGDVDGAEDITISNSIVPERITKSLKHAKRFNLKNNVITDPSRCGVIANHIETDGGYYGVMISGGGVCANEIKTTGAAKAGIITIQKPPQ